MNSFKNILLINFGGIGDEILFLPVIQALKKQYPTGRITLCLEKRSSAFLNLTDLIDNHIFINIKTKNKYIEMIKLYLNALFGHYDLVISSGANPLIAVLLFFTGIKTRIGYSTTKTSKLLTYPVILNKKQYASNMYFDLVKPVVNQDFELAHINTINTNKIQNSILIHPGVSAVSIAKNITKTLNAKVWAKLIQTLLEKGKKVYLAGGPDDEKCINIIREELKDIDKTNFQDLYGKTKNIMDLACLIKQSEVLICSDSAPMHIGVAVGTKTIAIFGPTDETKLLPDNNLFKAITNNSDCRPCLWEKRQTTCDEIKCLDIDIDKIIKEAV